MRRLLAVPLVLLLSACDSGGGTAAPSASGSASRSASASASASPSAAVLTEAQLAAALLTAVDLGAGWTGGPGSPGPSESEGPSGSPSGTASSGVCDLEADFGEEEAAAEASADFENTQAGAFLNHSVESYPPGRAAVSMAEGRDFFGSCTRFVDGESDFALSPWPDAPVLGDETIARKLTVSAQGGRVVGGLLVFRDGDVLSALFGVGGIPIEQFLVPAAQKSAAKI